MPVAHRLAIKVVPGASRSGIAGWLGDELKIRVSAPPDRGKANLEVQTLLAAALNLRIDQVTIVSGHTRPRKIVALTGIDREAITRVFGHPSGEA